MSGDCTVLHDDFVGGARVVLIDVTEGAHNVLDLLINGIEVLLSVHRHPERDDGLMTYVSEETTLEVSFDWQELGRELGRVDKGWYRFAELASTEALWSHVEPESVWSAVLQVGKKKIIQIVRQTP